MSDGFKALSVENRGIVSNGGGLYLSLISLRVYGRRGFVVIKDEEREVVITS